MSRKRRVKLKTLKIREETHARLVSHGKWRETIDQIIARLLDEVEKKDAQ